MPEPFKNFFNPDMIAQMGGHLGQSGDFDAGKFVKLATDGLEPLELKERSVHIREALRQTLPDDLEQAVKIMTAALHPEKARQDNSMDAGGIAGWAIMPMADYMATYGLSDPARSLGTLREMTMRFTAEFAVRPFFVEAPEVTLAKFKEWAGDANFHVRRLASEGSRPRLPWGMRLQQFVDDPRPILPLLEMLKDDPEEYVRRSVANSLNDIAKDHPALVAEIAKDWLKDASDERVWVVKHACRTLVKDGHAPTLKALGYGPPQLQLERLDIATPDVVLGGALEFTAELTSTARSSQPLIIDYAIHHRKANGSTSPKVFKLKIAELAAGKSLKIKKKHGIKPITTRKYYAGTHHLELLVNGQSFGRADFELTL